MALILLCVPALRGAQRDSLIVSMVTCWPGPEVYELCGHEALRIRAFAPTAPGLPRAERMDSVWNYGVFDFNRPNFLYRFVKGETDYMLAGYPFAWFMPEYVAQGRHVEEQELNLTQDEAWKLLGMLRGESRPENCTYRYNYVRDNCATRITDRLDQAASERVIYPDSLRFGTFRKEMRAYHRDYPWYQFGIDLCLGSGIDMPVDARAEMFVPVEMHSRSAGAHFSDGRPLVRATRVLNAGTPNATLPPTPWWLTPVAASLYALGLAVMLAIWQWRKRKIARWAYSVWFGALGLTGCLIAFLVFGSTHEATSPNMLLLWLNPLQLILAVGIWGRRSAVARAASMALAVTDIVVTALMLIVWPMQAQSANPAIFPLMCATLMLAAEYAIIQYKRRFNKNEKVGNIGAGSGRNRSIRPSRRRPSAPRGGHSR